MVIRAKKKWNDHIDSGDNHGMNRRELILRGLTLGALTIALPKILLHDLIRKAYAQGAPGCVAPVQTPGGIFSLFGDGGFSVGARILTDQQAMLMSSSVAADYGIQGTQLKQLGPNFWVDPTSPFGATLLAGPPGFVGGSQAWQSTVLKRMSGGAHLGPYNADDGAGRDLGHYAGVGLAKGSLIGKDLAINCTSLSAGFAAPFAKLRIRTDGPPAGTVAATFGPSQLIAAESMTPLAAGNISVSSMQLAATTAQSLSQSLAAPMQLTQRKGYAQMANSVGCGFAGNTNSIRDPNFGLNLFTAANIPGLTQAYSPTALASMSASELAILASAYQSAVGTVGSVALAMTGEDYHGVSPVTIVAPTDVLDARMIVMALAGFAAAKQKGVVIMNSNGNASSSGVVNCSVLVGATADNPSTAQKITVNAPNTKGDSGGSLNGGFILFYDPVGHPPVGKIVGQTFDIASGNLKGSNSIGSVQSSMAGLYASALAWTMGTVPQAFVNAAKAGGAADPLNFLVI